MLKNIIFLYLSIIFLITPYRQGIYFEQDLYILHTVIGTIFMVFSITIMKNKELMMLKEVALVVTLPFLYSLTSLIAETPQGNMEMIFRWTTYAAFLLMLYWLAAAPSIKQWMPIIFHLAASLLAIFTVLVGNGRISYGEIFIDNRLASVFQYPNTYAILLVSFYLFAVIQLTDDKLTLKQQVFYTFPLVLFFISLIQTYSRGTYLILPIVWLMGLILLTGKQKRLQYVSFTFVSAFLSIVSSRLIFSPNMKANLYFLFLFSLILTMLIVFIKKTQMSKIYRPRFLVLAIAIMALLLYIVPNQLKERVLSIRLGDFSAQERLAFVKDAFKIAKDSPIWGYGGKGWDLFYRKYQEYPYMSNKVHNGYLEWLVDTGYAGFFILMLVLLYFAYLLIKEYKRSTDKTLTTASMVALTAILIHVGMDFDFSFGTVVFICIWLYIMAINPPAASPSKESKRAVVRLSFVVICILSTFTIIFSTKFLLAEKTYAQLDPSDTLEQEEVLLRKVTSYNPYHIKAWSRLTDDSADRYIQSGNVEDYRKTEEMIKKLESVEPHNTAVLEHISDTFEKINQHGQANTYIELALKSNPLNSNLYDKSVIVKTGVATERWNQGDYEQAGYYAQQAIKALEVAEKLRTKFPQYSSEPLLTHFHEALAYFYEGDFTKVIEIAQEHREELIDLSMKSKLVALWYVSLQETNRENEAMELLNTYQDQYMTLDEDISYYLQETSGRFSLFP